MSNPAESTISFAPEAPAPSEEGAPVDLNDPSIKAALAVFEGKGLQVNVRGQIETGDPSKVEATKPAEGPAPEPLLAGKYKTPADLEKAYLELQKKLGGEPKVEPAKPGDKKSLAMPTELKSEPLPEDLTKALSEEILRDGNISEASRKRLWTRGYANEHIDEYLGTYKLARLAAAGLVNEVLGPKDQAEAKKKWAEENWDDARQGKLNDAFVKRDPDAMRAELVALNADYEKARGNAYGAAPIQGTSGAPTGPQPFRNRAEMLVAMNHPLYRVQARGPAADQYKAMVLDRIKASPNL